MERCCTRLRPSARLGASLSMATGPALRASLNFLAASKRINAARSSVCGPVDLFHGLASKRSFRAKPMEKMTGNVRRENSFPGPFLCVGRETFSLLYISCSMAFRLTLLVWHRQ